MQNCSRVFLQLDVDFEVDDALAKLDRFKLAVKDGDRWNAVPLAEAKRVLDERWDNKFTFHTATSA